MTSNATRTLIPDAPPLDEQGRFTTPWLQLFRIWAVTILAIRQAGPTTERPTTLLWVGRRFFDTTLNRPVYVYNVAMAAAGTGGWVNADGITV